ncbi:MAG: tRNA (adenosine(37)-N6)-dimethylallyltransferase MiaA [Clostridia bacterium]|nr:tRNA (adenosine(37)-N6)-dimethylallyltransferase MiaA [Clostridia bacterium]
MRKIIIVCGPTASGKSSLAFALAKKLNTEIISADSLCVYKNLDIGTAKPTKKEQLEIKHHLIDVVDETESFSVSDYEKMALPIIDDLLSKGKTPIICGGTGFYINSILYNLSYGKSGENTKIRQELNDLAKEKGNEYVYDLLKSVDKESAEKLHPNDLVRVIRALEIFYSTGEKKSMQNDKNTPRYDYVAVTIDRDRQELYNRIELRVDEMLKDGLIGEVQSLIDKGINKSHQCMQGIGYKEVYDAIISNDFSSLEYLLKLNTRHYAKRQITFFKKLPNLQYVSKDIDVAIDQIIKMI